MKLAIMQPYFLPYIGYFQLISAVDTFVVYDNIKFTKKGWMHRNRILVEGKDKLFTVPVRNDSDHLDVVQRALADSFSKESRRIIRRVRAAYSKAPFYEEVIPLIKVCFQCREGNLFDFIYTSLMLLVEFLEIDTEIIISSSVSINHKLKSQDKVLAICRELGASTYVNAIGGHDLYDAVVFQREGVDLRFIRTTPFEYEQFGEEFVPWLSIIDVMMFNSKERIQEYLRDYYSLEE